MELQESVGVPVELCVDVWDSVQVGAEAEALRECECVPVVVAWGVQVRVGDLDGVPVSVCVSDPDWVRPRDVETDSVAVAVQLRDGDTDGLLDPWLWDVLSEGLWLGVRVLLKLCDGVAGVAELRVPLRDVLHELAEKDPAVGGGERLREKDAVGVQLVLSDPVRDPEHESEQTGDWL